MLTAQRLFVCSLGPSSPAPGSNGGSGNPLTEWPKFQYFSGCCFVIVLLLDPIIFFSIYIYMYVIHANIMTYVPSLTPNIDPSLVSGENPRPNMRIPGFQGDSRIPG